MLFLFAQGDLRRVSALGWWPFVIAVALALPLAAGCSHTEPFIRGPRAVRAPPLAAVDHRLILIGDAGAPNPDGEPALELLEQRVRIAPRRTTVVFLGDNVYETGMPEPTVLEGTAVEAVLDRVLLTLFESRRDAERRLKAQVKAVRVPGARAVFIPGNHDWGQFSPGGWNKILAQQAFIDDMRQSRDDIDVTMLPRDGCPGPVGLDLGSRGRLLVLDTQWWLEPGSKPSPATPAGCAEVTQAGVQAALERELEAADAQHRRPIVVGHHPLASHGPHNDFIDPIVHVFPFTMAAAYVPRFVAWLPLPVLGSAIGWWRVHFSPSAQDFSGPGNAQMRTGLMHAMARAAAHGAPPLAYVGAHDHSLQVFRSPTGPRWLLVSGVGSSSKASGVRHDGATVFAHSNGATPGFIEIEFLTSGEARLSVMEWDPTTSQGVEVYSTSLTSDPA
jgi:hypothetical protein